jgi:hypothetical protein
MCIYIILQPTELEFVEVKRRNLIDESGIGYLHFNFLAKGLDDKHIMFFAEVHHDLEDENDVYACMPLREDDFKPSEGNDQGIFIFLSICYANTLVL